MYCVGWAGWGKSPLTLAKEPRTRQIGMSGVLLGQKKKEAQDLKIQMQRCEFLEPVPRSPQATVQS